MQVFLFQNNPKNLDPSFQMVLNHWDCFKRENTPLYNQRNTVYSRFALRPDNFKYNDMKSDLTLPIWNPVLKTFSYPQPQYATLVYLHFNVKFEQFKLVRTKSKSLMTQASLKISVSDPKIMRFFDKLI